MTVYFVSARELDLIKIGYAFNPVARYHSLRTASPVELTLEGAIPGGYEKEGELHKRFASDRMRGEWFRLSADLRAEIDASTRPEKFTWASVRLWLKKLAAADEALEQAAIPPEVRAEADRRIQEMQEAFDVKARRKLMTEIERRALDGDIIFPFRELASQET
jgi:hypothetical protein